MERTIIESALKRSQMSEAARKRIAEAQRKRWATWKAEEKKAAAPKKRGAVKKAVVTHKPAEPKIEVGSAQEA